MLFEEGKPNKWESNVVKCPNHIVDQIISYMWGWQDDTFIQMSSSLLTNSFLQSVQGFTVCDYINCLTIIPFASQNTVAINFFIDCWTLNFVRLVTMATSRSWDQPSPLGQWNTLKCHCVLPKVQSTPLYYKNWKEIPMCRKLYLVIWFWSPTCWHFLTS